MEHYGVDTPQVILTTDLGCEFDGDTVHYWPEGFHLTLQQTFGAEHRFNPSSCPNANADVESEHNTIEAELLDAQVFSSKTDFVAKTTTYQRWYNAARKDSSPGYKSPADLLALKAPHLSPKKLLLHLIPLESLLPLTGGHDVPGRMKTLAS